MKPMIVLCILASLVHSAQSALASGAQCTSVVHTKRALCVATTATDCATEECCFTSGICYHPGIQCEGTANQVTQCGLDIGASITQEECRTRGCCYSASATIKCFHARCARSGTNVAFLIDSSGSIAPETHANVVKMIHMVAEKLDLDKVATSIIHFNDTAAVNLRLDTNSLEYIKSINLVHHSGSTNYAQAVTAANAELATGLADKHKVAVVFSDGGLTVATGATFHTVAVGVRSGDNTAPNKSILRKIASGAGDSNTLFSQDNHSNDIITPPFVNALAAMIC